MKRFITVCLALFFSHVLLSVTYAEGIQSDANVAIQGQGIIPDTVQPEADELGELMLTGDDALTDASIPEAFMPDDRAVSAPVPKSGSCAHSKYSKITGGYKKYSKIDGKKHSVTALIPDDPSVTGVNGYFVKCDSCGEVGFFFDDGWDKRVTWESQGEAFYYEYSMVCTEKRYNEAHTFASGKCSKCGYKGSAATTVKLNKKSLALGVKETYKLTAKVKPASKAKSLRYKSTNTKVATVNARTGKITAKKAGTAKIQARIGTKTLATCKVTVKETKKRIELSKYLGKTFSEVKKVFGDTVWGEGEVNYGAYGEPASDNVEIFYILNDPDGKYSLFGFYLGMKRADAEKLLEKDGWEWDDNFEYNKSRCWYQRSKENKYYNETEMKYDSSGRISFLYGFGWFK